MSQKLSFKEVLARLGDAKDESPEPYVSLGAANKTRVLLTPGRIGQPVELAVAMRRLGLRLSAAHKALC